MAGTHDVPYATLAVLDLLDSHGTLVRYSDPPSMIAVNFQVVFGSVPPDKIAMRPAEDKSPSNANGSTAPLPSDVSLLLWPDLEALIVRQPASFQSRSC